MRTLLLALVVTAVLWWLARPRQRGRRADRHAMPEPTYKVVKTFRTQGGFDTTVWEAEWRPGGPVQQWHSWGCDCSVGVDGCDTLREATSDAVAHIERRHR
jgi:hypothetical protein